MTSMRQGRHTADLHAAGDEIVVFLIGMRINRPWKSRQWLPVFLAMPKMLKYLQQHPDKGLLGYRQSLYPSRSSSSTGDHSPTWNGSPAIPTTRNWSRGGSSTAW